jgi:osmotically-inducible protein OsmY
MRVPHISEKTACSSGYEGPSATGRFSAIGRRLTVYCLVPTAYCALALGVCAQSQAPTPESEPVAAADPSAGDPAEDTWGEAGDPAAAGDLDLEPEQVKRIQQDLKEQGYFFGPADGRKGPRTRTALRNYQRDQNLAVTGSLDQPTIDRLGAPATVEAPEQRSDPVQPVVSAQPRRRGGPRAVVDTVGGAITTGVKAVGTAGKATGKAGVTVGRATGKAGSVTASASTTAAKATATGAVVTAKAVSTAAVTVVKAPKTLYDRTRDVVSGDTRSDTRSDTQIQRSIETQYAEDGRLVPAEIEVRVADRHVTLVLPQGPRSDVPHAVRLAKLTPGVESVNVLYTAPPAPLVEEPADEPVLLPQTAPASEPAPEPPPDR